MKADHLTFGVLVCVTAALALTPGCTGTPMPIPPSLLPEALTVRETSTGPCPAGDPACTIVTIDGQEGATEQDALIIAHPLVSPYATMVVNPEEPLPILRWPYDGFVSGTFADSGGSFALSVDHLPANWSETVFRALIYGSRLSESIDFIIDSPAGSGQITILNPSQSGSITTPCSCLSFSPRSTTFNRVEVGDTATSMLSVENSCMEEILFQEILTWSTTRESFRPGPLLLDGGDYRTFTPLVQNPVISPGGTRDIFVVFWPETSGEHFGFLGASCVFSNSPVGPGASTEPTDFITFPLRGTAQ